MNAMKSKLLVLVITAMPAAGAPSLAIGASANPTVTVVNTTANPVPVTGQVHLGNSVVPVEVRNADPIPVSVVNSPVPGAIRGRWSGEIDASGKTPVIFAVPAGKRRVVTDVIASVVFSTPVFVDKSVILISECGANDFNAVVAKWGFVPFANGLLFQTSEHFTTGIVLSAGECLKVAASTGASINNNVTVLWYDENAT